jgi:predicted enzyme related to lactoylglutathione lyase
MLRTPDRQGIEPDQFHTPVAVDDIDAVAARMQAHGAGLIGQMQYDKSYWLAYIPGPEGIIVGLAEQLG